MTYSPECVNFGEHAYAAPASNSSPVYRGRNNRSRATRCCQPNYDSQKLVEVREEDQQLEAFQKMFLASRPKFVSMAYAILRNKEDAEDAVQNASLSAYRKLRTFEGRSGLGTWFTRIVLNAALMIRRSRKTSVVRPLPESSSTDDIAWTETIRAPEPDPEMICTDQEAFELIEVLLGKLSPSLQRAFTMVYYDEMSVREASVLLGISVASFKARLFRARQCLIKQAQRRLRAPIRGASQCRFSSDNPYFHLLPTRTAETSSLEVKFS